jgi:mannose-6-phosphate isomerase-like protein (cupin superfamily)
MWDRSKSHDRREGLFGGRGAVRVWSLSDATIVSPFQVVLACELEAGGSVGTHRQEELAEIVVVVSGSGSAALGDRDLSLAPGAVVSLPLGHTLALENASEVEPLRYLIIKALPA